MNEWYLSSLFQGGTCSRTVNKCLANKQSYKYIFSKVSNVCQLQRKKGILHSATFDKEGNI